jgi:hypothetical protein
MDKAKCSCDQFERLTGASVPAYSASFLERAESDNDAMNVLRCRVCGQLWERQSPQEEADGKRDSLVKLSPGIDTSAV